MTSDQQAVFERMRQACIGEPDNVEMRLILADWLEEEGMDVEADRHRDEDLILCPRVCHRDHNNHERTAFTIPPEHRKKRHWHRHVEICPEPSWLFSRVVTVGIRYGFIEHVELEMGGWGHYGTTELFSHHPIVSVHLFGTDVMTETHRKEMELIMDSTWPPRKFAIVMDDVTTASAYDPSPDPA